VKSQAGPLHALAATARLANVPSVISNVWLGLLIAGASPAESAWVTVSAVSLYLCGGFLNDWADRDWDRKHRPERALPGGIFAPWMYLALAAGCAAAGLASALPAAPPALAVAVLIAILIAIYTWLHKRTAWAVIPMGLCRALLPLLGLAAAWESALWPAAVIAGAGLFCHVAGISWMARGESRRRETGGPVHARWLFPLGALIMGAGCLWFFKVPPAVCLLGLLPYALWTARGVLRRDEDTAGRVAALLAGIPLVDWMLLLPLFMVLQAPATALWLPGLAFLAGRLLQRLTPAT